MDNIVYLLSFIQVTLQEGCNKILVADCFSLLQKQFKTSSRGQTVDEETLCGGCGGRIVNCNSADLSDAFVFNCKHAFHTQCFGDELDQESGSGYCVLCNGMPQ